MPRQLENEMILKTLNVFAEEIKLWVESKQRERIAPSVDRYACIITAYMYGREDGKYERP